MTDQRDESDQSGSGHDVPDPIFPKQDSKNIAIHEYRVYFPDGRLKRTIRERTVGEVTAQSLPPLIWGESDFELNGESFHAD